MKFLEKNFTEKKKINRIYIQIIFYTYYRKRILIVVAIKKIYVNFI